MEDKQTLLALIEERIMWTTGFLHMIHQLAAIQSRFMAECEEHENELGEALEAVHKLQKGNEASNKT